MIQNDLCKNPWSDNKLEAHPFGKLWKTIFEIVSLKKKDSWMKTIP